MAKPTLTSLVCTKGSMPTRAPAGSLASHSLSSGTPGTSAFISFHPGPSCLSACPKGKEADSLARMLCIDCDTSRMALP